MIPGEDALSQAEQVGQEAVQQAAEVGRETATETANTLEHAAAAVADGAEQANQQGAKVASAALGNTSQAFGAARERLNAMSGALPGTAQEMLRPFEMDTAFGKNLESSYGTAVAGMAEFNSKAIAAWRNNAESTIQHWQKIASAKSFSEAIALSAEHTRQQLEAVTAQTRELSALATRIVRDAADPLKLTGR